MSLSHLLAQTRPLVEQFNIATDASHLPGYVLFFSVSNGQERAHIEQARGETLDNAWIA